MTIAERPIRAARVDVRPTAIRRIQRNPLAYIVELHQQHGDVLWVPLRVADVVLVNHPDAVQHVLQSNHLNYSKDTIQYNTLSLITGRGLLTSEGELWLRQRRLAQPAFHRRRLQGLGQIVRIAAARMLDRWDRIPAGMPVDIDEEMMMVTLDVVGRALFSLDLKHEGPALHHAILDTLDYTVHRAQTFVPRPLWLPTPTNRRFQKARRTLDSYIYATIAARQARTQRRGSGGEPAGDLLDMLLEAEDEQTGERMTATQIRDEVITLIIAGYETVASALIWTWHLLSEHADVRERLEVELADNLQERLPDVDDLPALPFTRAIFDETLRLYPPAWLITRRARAGDTLGELFVPPRATIVISPYALHRHADFWTEPELFDPGRFLQTARPAPHRYAYIPFGAGPRLCIGDNFAKFEAQLLLATVAQRFRLNRAAQRPLQATAGVTLRPKGGLWMILEPR